MQDSTQTITPFLWFDNQAGEAARFYTSVFPDSRIVATETYSETPSGTVEVYRVEMLGRPFTLMSAGPIFRFNEAISFVIDCRTQDEIDYYWDKLTSGGGEAGMCGWLKDRFGVSWQVVPARLGELLAERDQDKAGRVMQAMLTMHKLDIETLENA